ncbi:MAG: sugar transferase, partial [Acidobacteria bacterium]|nr:sugar transferase [Acidobacteriota bacterium]
QVFFPTSIVALLLSEAVLLFSCYLLAIYLMFDVGSDVYLFYEGGLLRIAIVVASVMLGAYFNDLYGDLRLRSKILLLQRFSLMMGMAFIAQAFLSYGGEQWLLPRWTMITGSAMAIVVLPIWRIVYSSLVLGATGPPDVLFVGGSPIIERICSRLESRPEIGFRPIGFLSEQGEAPVFPHCKHVGTLADLRAVVERLRPARIIVAMSERRARMPVAELLEYRLSGILVEEAAQIYEAAFGQVCTSELRPSQLIFSAQLGPRANNVFFQNLYSLVMASVGLLLAAPILAIVAVLVRLTSKGPILYRQVRVGLNGKHFVLYKFRSMTVDAEAVTGAVWAQENDPRVTRLGKWLRLLRLDELPQLFNVLRGEMSMVGPRPERPEFVKTLAEKIRFYHQRHCVKPGITGWAQINYKYGNTLEDTMIKLEYDLYYIKNMSWSLDFYVIFHTVKTMLMSRGAH